MSRFHVAIAALCGTTGGPASYARRLVQALAAADAVQLSVLTDAPQLFAAADGGADILYVPTSGGLDRLRWQHVAVPRAIKRLAPDVYHDTKNALPRGLRCPAVVTVHDLAYHTVPKTFGTASRWFLRHATRDAIKRAQLAIVPSKATESDLLRYYPSSKSRTHVVPHGIDPPPSIDAQAAAAARQRLSLPEDYVLHVGTLQARKNVDLVIAAVRQLRARGLPHRAVLIGRRGWLADRAIAEIERDDTAIWLEHVSQEDLYACYAGAAAFASPSAYEGFGLAVADALAFGVPTVIADVSSLPELCGSAALRLPALTSDAIASALEPILRDDAKRAELSAAAAARAREFSWQAAAAGHLQAYREAMQ
ncbi:MAG: glycosyltransferase family 4 protein [Planctomycetota bacterium]